MTVLNRRRFLCLSAAALLPLPGHAETVALWEGRGLGTTLSLRLVGVAPYQAQRVFSRIEAEVERIENLASLHRDSALTRLNRDGHLAWPSADLLDLLGVADRVFSATGGAFDPTVQPLWQAIATGQDQDIARRAIGWGRIAMSSREIRLDRGQALTLNGIAQGWAADRIAALLRHQGFTRALVDMGEISAIGQAEGDRDWSARISAPDGTRLADVGLKDRALATSSPLGTVIGGGRAHILGPNGQPPLWQTASVSAPSAAVADALSTAFCLMGRNSIDDALRHFPGARLEALA